MTVEIVVSTTIAADKHQVWKAIEDIESHITWMAEAVSITFLSEQRSGVGTEFECLTRIGPWRTIDKMRVTEWEPGSAIGIEHRGLVAGSGHFTLQEAGQRSTEFCWRENLTFPWWFGGRLGERVGRGVLVKIWRNNLTKLRTQIEDGLT